MMKIQLKQKLYKIENECIVEHIVVGIYNLEKIKQDQDNYFFDARNQLVATISEKEVEEYKGIVELGILKGVIESYRFKPICEVFEKMYLSFEDAEKVLKNQQTLRRQQQIDNLIQSLEAMTKDIAEKSMLLKKLTEEQDV